MQCKMHCFLKGICHVFCCFCCYLDVRFVHINVSLLRISIKKSVKVIQSLLNPNCVIDRTKLSSNTGIAATQYNDFTQKHMFH